MDDTLKALIRIYQPNGTDWLNCKLSKKNPYTYHHILEVRNGGKRTIINGAILTANAHHFLNVVDLKEHRLYDELNYIFKELNRTGKPPTEDYYEEVNKILVKVKLPNKTELLTFYK